MWSRHVRRGEQLLVAHRRVLLLARITVEAETPLLQGAQRLLQALGEGAPDRHHLAHRLHLRAEDARGARQLLERPAWDLGDDVVDDRLERRRGGRLLGGGDVVRDLVERVADGELRRDLGDRESGRLRGERRAARHPRVHLDHDLAAGGRIDGELHVRATGLDTDATDAGDRRVSHLLVLDVGERLDRRHGDRVAGVDAHRIDVLDAADDHAVVRVVTHDLELVLLPPDDRLLDEDLPDRTGVECLSPPSSRTPRRWRRYPSRDRPGCTPGGS